jgi:undecaprenyl diphosphate synthase
LLWQSAYAELVFDDTPWPEFDRRNLWRACLTYAQRDRRFGGAGPVG